MAVKGIPEGYHSLTPYFVIKDADRLMEFLQQAFGAQETVRMNNPDGTVMHAEMRIGDSAVMMTDENPAWNCKAPATLGGSPVSVSSPSGSPVLERQPSRAVAR